MQNDNRQTMTPLQRTYFSLKREAPQGYVLLLRLGDFYEMFGNDAILGAQMAELAISHRAGQPMSGVPCHAVQDFLEKASACNMGVALADRMESGRRPRYEITRIVKPA